MKYLPRLLLLMFLPTGIANASFAQDTLPGFKVANRFGKIIVSWVNPFDTLIQINIQRSKEMNKGFKSITSIPDPNAITNGYLDSKAPDTMHYYKLYVQQTRGRYFVTTPQRPVLDTSRAKKADYATQARKEASYLEGYPEQEAGKLKVPEVKQIFTPSIFVYANQDGHVVLALPENKSGQYSLKFFREDGTPLFTMNKIRESYLIVDKSNFHRSGWYLFELYEGDILREKHKVLIPKDRH